MMKSLFLAIISLIVLVPNLVGCITIEPKVPVPKPVPTPTPVPVPLPEIKQPSEEPKQNAEAQVTMKLVALGKKGDSYRYRTVLEEKNGVDVYIGAMTREFVHTNKHWTYGRDFLLERIGSYIVPANGKLEWETSFEISEARSYFEEHREVIYREGWYGTDANGNAIGVTFSISTSDF